MSISSLKAMILNRLRRRDIYCHADYWDAKASEYDEQTASWWPNLTLTGLQRQELRRVMDTHLHDIQDRRVLDLGCGTGQNSRYLASRGATVTGIDFSAKAIEVARSRGEGPSYEVGSVFDLSVDEPFEYVMVIGVFTVACQTADDLDRALQRVVQAVEPGGRILLVEPVHAGPLHRVLRMGRGRFLTHLEQAGLCIEHVEPVLSWPARVLVGYVNLPSWITTPVYHIGNLFMKTLRIRWFGDYMAVSAVRPEAASADT